MIILHAISSLSGGGAERQLNYIVPELVRTGHEVHIAFIHEGPARPSGLDHGGAHLHQIHAGSNYDPRILWQLFRLINRLKPDILHTWIMQMDILGGIAACTGHVPWVLREPTNGKGDVGILKRFIRTRIAAAASAIISNSMSGSNYWKAKYKSKPKYIIPNAVPVNQIENEPISDLSKHGIKPNQKTIIYVGRFTRDKNIFNLIDALHEVLKNDQIGAILCGTGPLLESARKRVSRLGLSGKVHLPGYLSDAWGIMKHADIFISISNREGVPNAVLEAIACGCPLVVSDIPQHRAFLDGNSAVFVDQNNPSDVSQAIIETFHNIKGARERSDMARRNIQGWSVSSIAKKYQTVYDALIKS